MTRPVCDATSTTAPVAGIPSGDAAGLVSPAVQGKLSDLAVSPFALPIVLLRGEVRVAWIGRTSTQERQDPRQSLVRQLDRCRAALPASWAIVAHFYDVESGRMELDQRGRGSDHERCGIPIARAGGIADLLDHARTRNKPFDVVICESTARVARRMYEGMSVERELERAGVPLFAWNEPIKLDGGRAQQMLQRRINQAVAEYEVLNTLEQSWGGLCTHVKEGWNIGKPPYGYTGRTYRHPNPGKADKGITKTRLEPDGVRAQAVTQIAAWRYFEGLPYETIAQRLNADPVCYPPPEPPGKRRAAGCCGKHSVYEVLRNPKYTGFQVFNRRASRSKKGKVNDPELWVWSPAPAHEPLIPKWMFDELAASRGARRGSRWRNDMNRHPQTKRTYVLRGMVFCACGRRMAGKQRGRRVYYSCSHGSAPSIAQPRVPGSSTKGIHIREDLILTAATELLHAYVITPARSSLDHAQPDSLTQGGHDRHGQAPMFRQHIGAPRRREHNLLRYTHGGESTDACAVALQGITNAVDRDGMATINPPEPNTASRFCTCRSETETETDGTTHVCGACLRRAPAALLRRLFEATRLAVQLHHDGRFADLHIVVPAQFALPSTRSTAD
ncbi:hypothetical protein GCM10010174_89010 [Kutzneria viridogrisea]|uniref:DNA invertase Pin-like site-specific DNA recombinase n=1 Tax=Kutzneria viridogrisea TaxID=47990 RepID=A0ABR6BIU2_9PSEU|nr:DNA invertase Pin-like site-specific DNA recombinase [Kutzneria viridogrisea]